MIKKLQKKLVKYLFYRKLIDPLPEEDNYIQCRNILKIEPLEKRRIFTDLKFLTRSLKNQIDTQSFIHNINLNVPQRSTRSSSQFTTHTSRSDTGKYSIFNRMMSSFNVYGDECDLFFDDTSTLLNKLKANLNSLYVPTF
jgi:hypothetical protein